jgi:hypothetical protein
MKHEYFHEQGKKQDLTSVSPDILNSLPERRNEILTVLPPSRLHCSNELLYGLTSPNGNYYLSPANAFLFFCALTFFAPLRETLKT